MKREYNVMVFKTFVQATSFISALFETVNDINRLDVHIYQEETDSYVVEWISPMWDCTCDSGSFKFVDANGHVIRTFILPDNSCITCESKEEFNDFVHKHNDLVKTENDALKQFFEGTCDSVGCIPTQEEKEDFFENSYDILDKEDYSD